MELQQSIDKLNKYFKRLSKGKAEKIKPSHVQKVIKKLRTREALLEAEYAEATKDTKKKRIKHKLHSVQEQITRAEWLLKEIE